ncbi:hypothetical protein [Paracoccus ravus]|uniref:hypothetical protein n=1 Tax=Paracoccus ravus TaxID=2447760 RepID=UPI00106E81E4|nr:hypothetical protein [Paracoccus ravus]
MQKPFIQGADGTCLNPTHILRFEGMGSLQPYAVTTDGERIDVIDNYGGIHDYNAYVSVFPDHLGGVGLDVMEQDGKRIIVEEPIIAWKVVIPFDDEKYISSSAFTPVERAKVIRIGVNIYVRKSGAYVQYTGMSADQVFDILAEEKAERDAAQKRWEAKRAAKG